MILTSYKDSMKGIILSSGNGTRLRPITCAYQKQLLPVYDKPMIYYSISLLMMLEIRDIAIVITGKAMEPLKNLLNNGRFTGINITYIREDENECEGIAKAMTRCCEFIQDDNFVMVLGDTLLYGAELVSYLKKGKDILEHKNHAFIFETLVSDPTQFGTIQYDENNKPIRIVEKSKVIFNHRAIPGIYFFTPEAMEYAKKISKSARNEYEITSVLQEYMQRGALEIQQCGRGIMWIDTGTPNTINNAASLVQLIEENTGVVIACLEEIAYNNGWIDKQQLAEAAEYYKGTEYGDYLLKSLNK